MPGTFCDSGEDEVDVGAFFGGDLIEGDLLALGVVEPPLFGDCSFLLHVDLVADDHGDDVSLDELSWVMWGLLMVLC